MDTVSRESNRNYAILAGALAGVLTGVLVGLVALALWSTALVKIGSLSKKVDELSGRLADIESRAEAASAAADKANANIARLQMSVQSAFDAIGPEIGNIRRSIQKLQDTSTPAQEAAPEAPAAKAAGDGPSEQAAPHD